MRAAILAQELQRLGFASVLWLWSHKKQAMMSKHARVQPITDPTDKVCELMRKHSAGERGSVSTVDAVLSVLFDKGLARCDKIAWEDFSVPYL